MLDDKRNYNIHDIVKEFENLKGLVKDAIDEESRFYESLPRGLINSRSGLSSRDAYEALEEAMLSLNNAIETLESINEI